LNVLTQFGNWDCRAWLGRLKKAKITNRRDDQDRPEDKAQTDPSIQKHDSILLFMCHARENIGIAERTAQRCLVQSAVIGAPRPRRDYANTDFDCGYAI
jgi:hypothetical protein